MQLNITKIVFVCQMEIKVLSFNLGVIDGYVFALTMTKLFKIWIKNCHKFSFNIL